MNNLQKENENLRKTVKRLEEKVGYYNNLQGAYAIFKNMPFLPASLNLARKIKSKSKKTLVINNVKSTNPKIIAVCHSEFRGVRSATYSLVSDVIETQELYYKKDAEKVAKEIVKYSPEKILIGGYPLGYDLLVVELKKLLPSVRIFFVSHASFTWYNMDLDEAKNFSKMTNLAERGLIEKVGFAKRDNAEFFKEKGLNSYFLMNRFSLENKAQRKINLKNPNIGVTGSNMWHRNLLNQVVAGQMVENSTVHVNELNSYDFLDETRLKRHGVLPKDKFDKLMESFDVNMYVSFTDCFPMAVIESMSLGIPCITSDTSDVYAWSDYLKSKLIVSKIDSPVAISEKIKEVLSDHKKIQEEIKNYLPELNKKVEKSIEDFLK